MEWHERDDIWDLLRPLMYTPAKVDSAGWEVDRMMALMALQPPAEVLDLACGIGRHCAVLHERGFQVCGVDRTSAYLDEARQHSGIEYVLSDMREFKRDNAFDAVLNMFTAFGYFEDPRDDVQVLRNVHRSLRRGGRFLLELMGKEILARIYVEREWWERDGMIIAVERSTERDWTWVHNRYVVLRGTERSEFTMSHRIYSAAELRSLMESVGFANVRCYGHLDGRPYNHKADRLVLVADRS